MIVTKQPGGLHAYMVKWNELAVEADKLGGVKGVKVHTSEFESYLIAEKRVAWLTAEIEKRRPAPAPGPVKEEPKSKKARKPRSKKVATKERRRRRS
jgi:hypothetical protein